MKIKEKNKNIISSILRFTIAVSIIFFLTYGNKKLILQTIQSVNPKWFILAIIFFFLSFTICIARWYSLLRLQNINISFFETFSLGMKGMFFSLIIPGAVGGDLAKAGFISAKTNKGMKTKAVFSILIDRILGLLGLFILAAVLGIINFKEIAKFASSAKIIVFVISIGIIIAIIGIGMIFFHRSIEKIRILKIFLETTDKYTNGMPSRLMEALDQYRKSYVKLILWIFVSAIFVHTSQGVAVYCLINGTGNYGQKINYVILTSSLANALGAIPITPSGLGTRDIAITSLLTLSGLNKEKAISVSIMNTGLIILFNLSGGIFLLFKTKKKILHTN